VEELMRLVVEAGEKQIMQDPCQWMSWFGLMRLWERAAELQAGGG
jgi:hypothetical protein